MRYLVVRSLALLLACAAPPLAARQMSIPETVEFVQRAYCGLTDMDPVVNESRRANPAARPQLYRMLQDPAHKDVWPQIVGSFAYLGRKEDIAKLEAFMFTRSGVLEGFDYNAVMMVFAAYGGMAERGTAEAGAKLKEMMNAEYWHKAQFRTHHEIPPGYPSFVNGMRLRAFRGYAYARADDFGALAQTLIDSESDARERAIVEREVGEIVGLEREYRKSAKH
jgi:hypothetical protein